MSLKEKLIWVVCLAFACFHMYTALTGSLEALYQRAVHYMFAGFLVFLLYPTKTKRFKVLGTILDTLLAASAVIPVLYLLFNQDMIMNRFYYFAPFTWYEYLFCIMLVVSILEGTRRKMGLALPIIAIISIAYMMFGKYLPGAFGNSGFSTIQLVDTLYTTTEGIFGVALGASATFVILFVIFGAFLEGSGVGDYFISFARALTQKSVGGSAKTAVISSCLFGSISGSTIANVATTGQITIPMMKKAGYSSTFAGAVEAVASTGGQIMPPVMGSAAFIMSEFTGIPYSKILLCALVPALLYYLAVFIMVHLEARKIGILPSKEENPELKMKRLLKKVYLFLPLVVLVIILANGYSPTYSVMFSLVSVIIISYFDKNTRLGLRKILNCFVSGAKGVLGVAMACSCAGIVVGVINYTGVGVRLSALLLDLSQNNLMLALVLTAVTALILGMGLPTTPSYIVVATLLVPAIIRMDVPVIAAHLFAFYFANISGITPPVALAAYTAASLSKADPMKTGYQAFFLGIASYIVPFMFVFNSELLLMGDHIGTTILAVISSGIGVAFLATAVEGFFVKNISILQRIPLIAGALMLIKPGWITDIIGLVLGLAVILPLYLLGRKNKMNKQTA